MDEIEILDKIKKLLESRESQIQETLMSGSLKDMEHYKSLQGELTALNLVEQQIQDFYAKGER